MGYEITKWQVNILAIVNDLVRSVDLKSLEFSCRTRMPTLNVYQGNGDGVGEFTNYSYAKNQKFVNLISKPVEIQLPLGTIEEPRALY